MRPMTTLAVLTALATSTRSGHMAFECVPGTDLSGVSDVLPAETIEQATATGLAIVSFDGFVGGALAFCDVERRMSLIPGGTVTLVQDDGSVRTRSQPLGNVVAVDLRAREAAPLPLAA